MVPAYLASYQDEERDEGVLLGRRVVQFARGVAGHRPGVNNAWCQRVGLDELSHGLDNSQARILDRALSRRVAFHSDKILIEDRLHVWLAEFADPPLEEPCADARVVVGESGVVHWMCAKSVPMSVAMVKRRRSTMLCRMPMSSKNLS